MNRVFHWAMRHGAPILFWLAVALFLLTVISIATSVDIYSGDTLYVDPDPGLAWNAYLLFSSVISGLYAACIPFGMAVIVDRADRWLGTPNGGPTE